MIGRNNLGKFVLVGGWFYLLMVLAGLVSATIVNYLNGWFVELAKTDDFVLEYRNWISAGIYLVGVIAWIGVILIIRNPKLGLRKNDWVLYKVGDPHPHHKFLAFVEYDEQGHGVWTSVYGDTEAPYRLAKASAQRRTAGTRISPHNEDSQACPPDTSVAQLQSVQGDQLNKNQSG